MSRDVPADADMISGVPVSSLLCGLDAEDTPLPPHLLLSAAHTIHSPEQDTPGPQPEKNPSQSPRDVVLTPPPQPENTNMTSADGAIVAIVAQQTFASESGIVCLSAPGKRNLFGFNRSGPTPPLRIFVKRTAVSQLALQTSPTPARRKLHYAVNEARFYQEFAGPTLRGRGVSLPKLGGCVLREPGPTEEPPAGPADSGSVSVSDGVNPPVSRLFGSILLLESFDVVSEEQHEVLGVGEDESAPPQPSERERFLQQAPFSTEERAVQALSAVAALHAATFEDKSLLKRASERLQKHGGSFHLSIRDPAEAVGLGKNFDNFLKQFPEAFEGICVGDQQRLRAVGARLAAVHAVVSAELSPSFDDKYATLIHGDFKAMNVLLRRCVRQIRAGGAAAADHEEEGEQPEHSSGGVLIDFAQSGVGFGMSDVAFLLVHSVSEGMLEGGGEARLVRAYLRMLRAGLRSRSEEFSYPEDVALQHYRLGVLDYGRFVIGRFWGDASKESFRKKANNANVTLPNRRLGAALRLIENLGRCLEWWETGGQGGEKSGTNFDF